MLKMGNNNSGAENETAERIRGKTKKALCREPPGQEGLFFDDVQPKKES
jgi:hypothetical protein